MSAGRAGRGPVLTVPVRPRPRGAPGSGAATDSGALGAGIGANAGRPDGIPKVTGEFQYASDLWLDGMIWGVTLRSPHPYARIRSVDIGPALATPGVSAVLTHEDVPGRKLYGLEIVDQPVLAVDTVRYQGEPVALVAADHPEIARQAAKKIVVDWEVLEPVTDARAALGHRTWDGAAAGDAGVPRLHPDGNLVRHLRLRKGDPDPVADVVVTGEYHVGMQDQAFLGPESGLAVPAEDGGVELYVATQWLHVDQRQICGALGLPPEKVRLTLAGVGGAFGGREDLSMHVHACLLALHTGKPVKMVYNREESFFGHVHRHPAVMRFEHGARRDGTLVYVKAQIYLDGGAYASSTPAVVGNAGTMGIGPYVVPHVQIDAYGAYTNNPPCGAMRGFGSVQAAFAHEAQIDRLAGVLGLDPVELRCRNAMTQGSAAPTGQVIDSPAPVEEMLRRVQALPMPPAAAWENGAGGAGTGGAGTGGAGTGGAGGAGGVDLRDLPGGVANTTHGEGVVRGVGYAVAYKNVGFSEGFDDYSTARVRLEVLGGEPVATVHTAAAEVGQGLVTVEQQIARTELGVHQVTVHPKDTAVGSAGSSSASRQTYVTGGAVKAACEKVRERALAAIQRRFGRSVPDLRLAGGKVISDAEGVLGELAGLLGDEVIDETVEWRHRPTYPVDPETGQGFAHVQYAFAAHRAVVDVDTELGLLKVVALDCVQDVGKAINPQAVVGQIQGGSAQGMGLAVMEEIQIAGGKIRNPSFTDYLIPTILDMPPMQIEVLEYPDPHAPYGLRGVGEPPTISSGPAIVAAIRAATGLPLNQIPVRPEHITGTRMTTASRPATGSGVRLAELLAVLSLGTDLGMGQPMEHVLRQCLISLRLAQAMGLDAADREVVFYAALLAWVGCHVDAYEQARWFGDDLALKADFRRVDFGSAAAGPLFMLRHLGAGRPAGERVKLGAGFAGDGRRAAASILENHWLAADSLAERLGLAQRVRDSVEQTFERWDGKGVPKGARGEEILVTSRLVNLADVVEVYHYAGGTEAAIAVARQRSGTQFDPQVVDVFAAEAERLFADLDSASSWDAVIGAEPALGARLATPDLDAALAAIADFTDVKSPFTIGHSRGVADLAGEAALRCGLGPAGSSLVRRAGLVHDLGRLGVSNAVWDKPGALSHTETERVRLHPYLTERMLACCPALAPLAAIAVQHHERLDGSGYPRGLSGGAIGTEGRLLAAADFYQSRTEPRPHRPAVPAAEAASLLRAEARAGRLDGDAVAAVLAAAGHRAARRQDRPAGLTGREVEVLRLLARGLSTRQIAEELVISRKTASHHIEHIYAKTGTTNRALASLFAASHGLIGGGVSDPP